MHKREALFTTKVQHWIKKNLQPPCAIEVKHTRGKGSFAMRELAPHQRAALLSAQSPKGFTHKIPDCGYTNPFDLTYYGNMYAYVIICYPKAFYVIDIEKLLAHKKPSLTESEAERIAFSSSAL